MSADEMSAERRQEIVGVMLGISIHEPDRHVDHAAILDLLAEVDRQASEIERLRAEPGLVAVMLTVHDAELFTDPNLPVLYSRRHRLAVAAAAALPRADDRTPSWPEQVVDYQRMVIGQDSCAQACVHDVPYRLVCAACAAANPPSADESPEVDR